jgi:hypothetical protein
MVSPGRAGAPGTQRKVHPWWTLAILVLAPVAVLVLLLHVLDPVAYGLLALPVHLVVLVYSLGRGDAKGALGPVP